MTAEWLAGQDLLADCPDSILLRFMEVVTHRILGLRITKHQSRRKPWRACTLAENNRWIKKLPGWRPLRREWLFLRSCQPSAPHELGGPRWVYFKCRALHQCTPFIRQHPCRCSDSGSPAEDYRGAEDRWFYRLSFEV